MKLIRNKLYIILLVEFIFLVLCIHEILGFIEYEAPLPSESTDVIIGVHQIRACFYLLIINFFSAIYLNHIFKIKNELIILLSCLLSIVLVFMIFDFYNLDITSCLLTKETFIASVIMALISCYIYMCVLINVIRLLCPQRDGSFEDTSLPNRQHSLSIPMVSAVRLKDMTSSQQMVAQNQFKILTFIVGCRLVARHLMVNFLYPQHEIQEILLLVSSSCSVVINCCPARCCK